ncbi:MAG: hypothetical protein ACF8Q5_14980 [Phycisphaerales bacterium JB040]
MPHDHRPTPTPLPAVLAVTALASVGTGAVTNGVFFLARSAYGYQDRLNLTLAVVLGAAYIAGALAIGPALRRLARVTPWLSTRGVLAGLLLLIACAACLPVVARDAGPASLWVAVLVFAPATGAFWPIVEGYLSGGRRSGSLMRAIGAFNITWSVAVVAAMWLMVPLVKEFPLQMLALVGGLHALGAACLVRFRREPARTDPDAFPDEPHPDSYRTLLAVFRVLLPLSYVLLSALSPLLPGLLDRLGIALTWQPALASCWMLARVLTFMTLERWHAWHGSRAMAAVAGTLMLLGFAGVVLSPWLGAGGVALLVLALTLFGIGMAGVYVGALYYVMEVGHGGVDAGGAHEAVIGAGYTLGPAVGLLAGMLAGGGDPAGRDAATLAMLGVLAAIALGAVLPLAVSRVRHDRRAGNNG